MGPDTVCVTAPVAGKSVVTLQTCTLPDYSERDYRTGRAGRGIDWRKRVRLVWPDPGGGGRCLGSLELCRRGLISRTQAGLLGEESDDGR